MGSGGLMTRLQLLAFRLMPLVMMMCGCGTYTTQDAIIAETLSEIHARDGLLDGFTVTLSDSPTGSCGGRGCTLIDAPIPERTIRVYGAGGDATLAELLCHEIAHVHLKDTTGDSDPTHRRQDLFSTDSGACGRVVKAFSSLDRSS